MEKEGREIHPLYKEGLVRFKDKLDRAEGFINKYNLQNPEEIKEAAIRFVLDNHNVNTVCCSARNFEEMERFVRLSGTRLTDWDKAKLSAYEKGCGELYCRHACGLCEPKCPQNIPIIEQLKEVTVTATAELSTTLLSFEETMSLEAGDILLLSKAINEPVDVIIEGRHFATAWPAKSAGNYAVVINELSC